MYGGGNDMPNSAARSRDRPTDLEALEEKVYKGKKESLQLEMTYHTIQQNV